MDTKKLDRWAELLLDTGKRNNLINFKDSKNMTAEVVFPAVESFYEKCQGTTSFEIFDPKIQNEHDEDLEGEKPSEQDEDEEMKGLSRDEYISLYSGMIRKNNQVLVYSKTKNPITAVRNIDKKARDIQEESGVNVCHLAFGFVHWRESENSDRVLSAPLLLLPITLKNKSFVDPYVIELTEDDPVVNPTLCYKLLNDFKIELPEYTEGETLFSYLEKVRAIVEKLHWEVTAECKIGTFAFLKVNMYNDLKNNQESILKNDNVRLLMGEAVEHEREDLNVDDVRYVQNEVIDLHTVVDADSSQIDAIEMAKSGKSFVLQGPPGTGKSQTITNIIAECLHDGKKVLFVSEKLAALNVVYDKLKKVGLDEFCLELHSHKARKKEVIADLCKTLQSGRSGVSTRAYDEVKAKAKYQKQLDNYVEALHKPIPSIGKSMYQLYEAYSAFRNAPDIEHFIKNIESKDEDYLKEASGLLGEYADYIPTIGDDYRKNPWCGYKNRVVSLEAESKLKQDLKVTAEGLRQYTDDVAKCKAAYLLDMDTLAATEQYTLLFSMLSQTQFLKASVLATQNIERAQKFAERLTELSAELLPIRKGLEDEFEASVYELNGQEMYNKLVKLYSGLFSRLFNADYKSMISDLRLASKSGKKFSYPAAKTYMKTLMDYQRLMAEFDRTKEQARDLLKSDGLSPDKDWKRLKAELEVVSTLIRNGLNIDHLSTFSDEAFENERERFGTYSKLLSGGANAFKQTLEGLQREFDASVEAFEEYDLNSLHAKMEGCYDTVDKVENWGRFYILLNQLEAKGLRTFVDTALDNGVSGKDLSATFNKLYYKTQIRRILKEDPILGNFARVSQDNAVKEFALKDKLQFEISKAQIRAELSAKKPSLDMMAGGSAVSMLLREGEKKRKQKNIRKLFEEAGQLIQVIKPCFLMSPLSVSTFLDADSIRFDTVVFDEASQIFPQDAIGAIYRGKQLIVVGDSKQMPPSNFFTSGADSDNDDEETGDVGDFESILDLCSASLPQLRLKWHYRSRYEQLIAFSNKNFYDNTLVTFPSSTIDHAGIGVDYYHVDSVFDRKNHTNRLEAEFVVDLIFKNIEEYPERSLGVVAFSVSQQSLIEGLLNRRRQEDTSKEWFFRNDETKKEPFFVKNLENVQGDERDTIIFSIAYGKDSQGRLFHNFGPLNRAGGERRLNVAVTRAKENVQLVSSMHGTDIDLTKTQAEGPRLLREYLDYAENGSIALEKSMSVNPFEQFDSEFEMEVCDFLRERGFSVDTQVGCSGFRIDLGLKRPNSSDYVLAIECDGATYHSSKNARDRDRLRQEVLENMGWRFYRIWSTDWFRNTAIEKELLFNAAVEAINLGHEVKQEKTETVVEEEASFESEIETKNLTFPEYKEPNVEMLCMRYKYDVQTLVKIILQDEAPISEDYLLKQICSVYDRQKVTSVVKDKFVKDLLWCGNKGIKRHNGYFYLNEKFVLRVPGVKREIKDIAPEELAAGLYELVKNSISVEKQQLYRTLINLLGFTRMSDDVVQKLDSALKLMKDRLEEKDGIVSLKG